MNRFILLLFVLTFIACGGRKNYGDKSIFRYNVSEGISSLDPAFARSIDNVSAVNHLFNGLLQTDDNLKLQACIAEKWEVMDEGKRYRFYLRDDVFYHTNAAFGKDSSRAVVAEDFIYSFNRLIDPQLISPGKWVMNEVSRNEDGKLKMVAVNDHILDIYLNRPFPPFLGILSMQYCSVVPMEAVEHYGPDFRANPVGTGPFRFKLWKENTKLVCLKNDNYFEKGEQGESLPRLDAISITFIKDPEVTFLKFLKGEIDYLTGLKGSYKDELLNSRGELREKYKGKVNFSTSPYLNTEYLGFLVDSSAHVLSKEVRRAINYGFDRQKVLTYLRNGIGVPAYQGFVPRGLPSFNEDLKGFTYQPDSVRSLLEKAGYPNGEGAPEITLSTTAQYLDICEYLQSQLSTFGLKLKVEVNQAATNNELIAHSKVNFFRKSWIADYPDAENYLSLFKSDNFAPEGPNYTHYSNMYYDALYDQALRETNDSLRFDIYIRMDSLILSEAPVVPLFYDEVVRFTHPNVSNLGVNSMNLLVLKYARKSSEI